MIPFSFFKDKILPILLNHTSFISKISAIIIFIFIHVEIISGSFDNTELVFNFKNIKLNHFLDFRIFIWYLFQLTFF